MVRVDDRPMMSRTMRAWAVARRQDDRSRVRHGWRQLPAAARRRARVHSTMTKTTKRTNTTTTTETTTCMGSILARTLPPRVRF